MDQRLQSFADPDAAGRAKAERETAASLVQRRAADPEASVWVSASAGTGKTKVLTDRVMALLLAGADPGRILCLTFTRAAAAEMQARLARALTDWVALPELELRARIRTLTGTAPEGAAGDAQVARARALFARVLDVPGGMKLQTIHSFCQSLLARFPIEAQVAPHFELLDELTAKELIGAATAEVLQQAAEDSGQLRHALDTVAAWVNEADFADLMRTLLGQRGKLGKMRTAYLGDEGALRELRDVLGLAEGETAAGIVAAACADGAFDGTALRRVCDAMLRSRSKTDPVAGRKLADWLAAPQGRAGLWDGYLSVFFTGEGEIRKSHCTKDTQTAVPDAAAVLLAEAERLEAVRQRVAAASVAEATGALLRLAGAVLDRYAQAKRAHARLDYEDLIQTSQRLLSAPGLAPWVLFKLDGGLDHLLIDEAQDTNPDQWRIVQHLTEEFFAGLSASEARDGADAGAPPRSVFAVGDPKQSIYSFQGASPAEFLRMRDHFARQVQAAQRGWAPVALTHSFRSVAPVLAAVDAVFREARLQRGVTVGDAWTDHDPVRVGQGGRVELWPPVAPEAADDLEAWSPPTERSGEAVPRARLAEVMAETIRRWVQAQDPTPGDAAWLESRGRPVRPGDVLVLVRRRNAFVEELIRALKQKAVPVAGIDRMVLTEQLAVMDLVALARVCLLPEDDLTLACVLKGPLVGLSEEQLFALAYARTGTLWQALRERAAIEDTYDRAYAYLERQRAQADLKPPFEFFAELLGAAGGRVRLLQRLGPDAADPLEEFLNLALVYEGEHRPSLEGFLHWLERGELEIKRDAEVQGQAVRVMTVHGAKGLQAPIVFLPDTMQKPQGSQRIFWTSGRAPDAELPLWAPRSDLEEPVVDMARATAETARDEEYWRLLYVALTRAEDRLYVCGYETNKPAPEGCWYKLSQQAWADLGEPATFDFTDLGPAGWSGEGRVLAAGQVARPQPEKPAERPLLDAVERALPSWSSHPPPLEPSPPRPLAPSRPSGAEPPLRSPLGDDGGLRFARGRLVHRLLQSLPDLPTERREAAARRFLAAGVHGLTPDQIEGLTAEVLAVLEDPAFAPLFGPGSLAEAPIVGLIEGPDGPEAVSGQVDRLCVRPDKVLVVDFKTNRPSPQTVAGVAPVYLRQMAIYCAVLQRIYPGRPVEAALLWTDGPRLMPLPEAALAAFARPAVSRDGAGAS